MHMLIDNLKQGLMITIFVMVMMILIDYFNVVTKGGMSKAIRGGMFRQYVTTSFLGVLPGCLGPFMNVSFYVHGLISFGAITAGMIATSGDEAFVMLALFPQKALLLFGILFVTAILSASLADKVAVLIKLKPCEGCQLLTVHQEYVCHNCFDLKSILTNLKKLSLSRFLFILVLVLCLFGVISGIFAHGHGHGEWDWERITFLVVFSLATIVIVTAPDHYLQEHIWTHIAKRHIWRVFLWTFGALLVVDTGLHVWDLESFAHAHMFWIVLIACISGLIPQSGPHLIFVMMFARGVVPFSVLLASAIVQDGHGMLPLLSYSVKDSILIKLFKLIIGLILGYTLYFIGW
ncbi:MAG: arsenic efflux protein [Candidatus Omnitrophica bacterium]|nr:arsenic efflux protein [Candidatus Omnitrophota bacterium]